MAERVHGGALTVKAEGETPAREPTDDVVDSQGDVQMKNAGDEESREDADVDEDADAEGEVDEEDQAGSGDSQQVPPSHNPALDQAAVLELVNTMSTYLTNFRDEDGQDLSAGFQRLPNKRNLPDYFDIIANPVAFSTIRSKHSKKQYFTFPEFVRDVAQICHNAQVYNRPSAPIFGAAVRMREIFKDELAKLVAEGQVSPENAELPYLGELPSEESPPPEEEEEEEEEEEDEEEDGDDDEEEDSEDEGTRRRLGNRRSRPSASGSRCDGPRDDDAHKRRGRPPKVFTPMEARIHAVLKGLRKFKDDDDDLLIVPFEKLPDKAANPGYYQFIKSPLALDHIKRRAKRKKYGDVDALLRDIEHMFENAKRYNHDKSHIYKAAVELQKQARILAQQEKDKPDEEFRDEDGKLPLSEIYHLGETWRVGDWVHIKNPNDPSKPTVAQLYRMWQDRAGQRWINACWYYRPEQTVHRAEKHFYEHEVVKTGQYRDHVIEEVVDRCFVMFVTRFPKGRPRAFPHGKDVYVCESRYNEERATFNKIKTWASCIPDEIRETDYEMDLFDTPRKMKKLPSPIKHLIQGDGKPTSDLPRPTWGNSNAPPIIGAVHMRPREPNESPPPGRTPSPSPDRPAAASQEFSRKMATFAVHSPASQNGTPQPFTPAAPVGVAPAQSPVPYPSQYVTATLNHGHPTTPAANMPPPSHPLHVQPPSAVQGQHPAAVHHQVPMRPVTYNSQPIYAQPAPPQPYSNGQAYAVPVVHAPSNLPHVAPHGTITPLVVANQLPPPFEPLPQQRTTPIAPPPLQQQQGVRAGVIPYTNAYNPPRPAETYVLPDSVNAEIPAEVRKLLHKDDSGRVLFFRTPPACRPGNGDASESSGLGHSIRYLAKRKRDELSSKAAEQWPLGAGNESGPKDGTPDSDSVVSGGATGHAPDGHPVAVNSTENHDEAVSDVADTTWGDVGTLARATWGEFEAHTTAWRRQSGIDDWEAMMEPTREEKRYKAEQAKKAAWDRLRAVRNSMKEIRERERAGRLVRD